MGGMGMKSKGGMHPMMLLHLKNSGRILSSEMLRLMMMGGIKPPAKNSMQYYLYDKLTACKEPIEECTPPNNYNNVNCGSEGETDDTEMTFYRAVYVPIIKYIIRSKKT